MKEIFASIDSFVASFMEGVFQSINDFWFEIFSTGGKGAYISALLILVFIAILLLIGLVRLVRKFGLFIFLAILLVGIPCLWYFVVLPIL